MDTLLSPRRRAVLQALAATTLFGVCGEWPSARAAVRTFRGETMGSFYTLKIAHQGSDGMLLAAHAAVRNALDGVDLAMSTHRPDSELSRFNAHAHSTPYAVSAPLLEVLQLAAAASTATAGAFDVTVAPLVDAWGFGPARGPRNVDDATVRSLEARVGFAQLAVDPGTRTVRKLHPAVRADLSGIAKGYGVDRAAAALDALGVGDYMIEAGGEVRVRGTNGGGAPWQIAIEQPDAVPQRPRIVLGLRDTAIATSGDYRIYYVRDGRRYCHEIDPATGRPMESGIASVSVVAPQCAVADALGKLIVRPIEQAYALATAHGLAAYFVLRGPGGRLHDVMTPAFAALQPRAYA